MKTLTPFILPFFLMSSPAKEEIIYLQKEETIHIGIEEKVDLSNSTVLWNGELLELNDDFSFTVKEEGKNTLEYVLKDSTGNVVDTGTKIYILDSIQPEIEVSVNDFVFEQTIGVMDQIDVKIKMEDENLKSKEVYIDGILQEEKEVYTLTHKNKKLKVMAEDECGHKVEKEYDIESISKPDCSSSITDPFTLEDSITFKMDDTSQLLVDGKEIEGKQYSFIEPDVYSFTIRSKKYPYLHYFQQEVTYTNIEPSVNIEVSALKGNQDVSVKASFDGDSITSTSFTSSDGQSMDFDQTYTFSAIKNKNQTITLIASVEDAFGQMAKQEVTFQINTIKPTMVLTINENKVSTEETFSFLNVESVHISHDGEKTEEFTLNNQKCSFSSLEEALKEMQENDELTYMVHLKDEFGNENAYEYHLKKSIILQTFISTTTNRTTGTQSLKSWSIDEQNHVTLKENTVKTNTKPIIYIEDEKNIQMGQTIDIVLINAADIQWLKVNGEIVDLNTLKKDSLNNLVYSYTLPNQTSLKIEMKDAQNQIDSMEYTVQSKQVPGWLYSLIPIFLIIGVVVGMRYV